MYTYSSTCHERPPPFRSESGPPWQVAVGYTEINTAKTVVGIFQKGPAKAGGRSPEGPAEAGTTVGIILTQSGLHVSSYLSNRRKFSTS